MESIAINVGANTNEPGFRGPVRSDGTFVYLPIPESKQTSEPVPTYGDIIEGLDISIPERVHETPVHLDPEFAEYPHCERYTYGDDYAVKAGPLSELSAGSYVFFYATLSVTEPASWLPPEWGTFLIGQFRLARDPVTGEEYQALSPERRQVFESNAHVKRDPFDARVLLVGDPEQSMLYDRAIPLSTPTGGTEPGWLVTDLSEDSGKGPWWRRPLRFDAAATEQLLDLPADPSQVIEGDKR
jgi:hypothetical protein